MARTLKGLPLQHIDTSIILEPRRTENGKYCTRYIQKVGYNYQGTLSMPVLAELFLSILLLDNYSEKHDLIDGIIELIKVRRISFYSPRNMEKIAFRIKETDKRIDPLDAQILACAIENNANLVTLDRKLIDNMNLEKEFGIKIFHPKSLL